MRIAVAVTALVACKTATLPTPGPAIDVIVSATMATDTAAAMASQVTAPLERQLGQMPRLAVMRSRTLAGSTSIELGFEAGTDIDVAIASVQAAINASAPLLPSHLPAPPTYTRVGREVARWALSSSQLPWAERSELAAQAARKLEVLPGIARIELCGVREREIDVEIDPASAASVGVTAVDAASAISALPKLPGGNDASALRDILVAERNGAWIKLRDVARIVDATAQPSCRAFTEQGEVVELVVSAQPGADASAVHDAVASELDKARTALPASVSLAALGPLRVLAARIGDRTGHETGGARPDGAVAALRPLGRFLVEVRDHDLRVAVEDAAAERALHELAAVPGVIAAAPDATLQLTSADPDKLATFASSLRPRLRDPIPLGLDRRTALVVQVDRARAAKLGLSPSDLDAALATVVGQRTATLFRQAGQVPIVVRTDLGTPWQLDRLLVRNASHELVPASAVVTTTRVPDGEILHVGQFPMVGFRVRASEVPDLTSLGAPPDVHVELVRD